MLIDTQLVARLTSKHQEQVKLPTEEAKKEEKIIPKKDKISLKEIDDKLMTIDDFLH